MDNVGGAKQAISRTTSLTARPERRPSVRSNVSRKSTRYVCLCSWSQLNLELSTIFREVHNAFRISLSRHYTIWALKLNIMVDKMW